MLYAALLLTYLVYQPGLSGTFLFDDHSNLVALERIKSNPTLDEWVRFLLSGISSPTGRPLSLATFALQAQDWPEHPGGFLYVNVLLHLLNGALLCAWLIRLARLLPLSPGAARFLPLAVTTLWLLAPLQATAVLYIVQRMTELAATFVFLGLLVYLGGREAGSVLRMSAGMVIGAGFGTLAKENAVLMPLLVLVLECTLLAGTPRPLRWRWWSAAFLYLPIAMLALYMALGPSLDAYAGRDFSLAQRLMSEARALLMYLYKLLLPHPSGIRLLYDDFPASTGLLQPWTTLPSILGVAGLIGGAWALRRRAPFFAFGVLWFFAAHVLESSVIPLELVFEHRNYQASVGILVAVVAGATLIWQRASSAQVRLTLSALAVVYVALLSLVTWQISTLWGRPLQLVSWWAEKLPDSSRARIDLIGGLVLHGLAPHAVREAERASAQWPDDPSFYLVVLQYACQQAAIPPPPMTEITRRIAAVRRERLTVINLIDGALTVMERGYCPHLSPTNIVQITQAALHSPALQLQRQNLLLLNARASKLVGQKDQARAYFRDAIDVKPMMILLIQGVLDELDAGNLEGAREYLRRAESDPRIRFTDRWSHRQDIEALKRLVALHEADRKLP